MNHTALESHCFIIKAPFLAESPDSLADPSAEERGMMDAYQRINEMQAEQERDGRKRKRVTVAEGVEYAGADRSRPERYYVVAGFISVKDRDAANVGDIVDISDMPEYPDRDTLVYLPPCRVPIDELRLRDSITVQKRAFSKECYRVKRQDGVIKEREFWVRTI